MSTLETSELTAVLDRVRQWPSPDRVRLARMILETVETYPVGTPPRRGSLNDLLGLLKTDAPPPNDEECRAILEEELVKKHLK